MKFREVAHSWRIGDAELLGIASLPERAAELGLIIIVGGPQYRVGSHRQFVLLARRLAIAGYPVLRFDVRGMGDSGGEARSFEQLDDDIGSAIDTLQALAPTVRRVALWGLCDAASAALLYQLEHADPRVVGLALLNPWVRSTVGLAKAQVKHYYLRRLGERGFWLKLLSGGIGLRATSDLLLNWRRSRAEAVQDTHTFQQRMALGWQAFTGHTLVILSEDDIVAQEFREYTKGDAAWQTAFRARPASVQLLSSANHTFSSAAWRTAVERLTLNMLQDLAPADLPTPQGSTQCLT